MVSNKQHVLIYPVLYAWCYVLCDTCIVIAETHRQENPCSVYKDIRDCRAGYQCILLSEDNLIECLHYCHVTETMVTCENEGVCFYEEQQNKTKCW